MELWAQARTLSLADALDRANDRAGGGITNGTPDDVCAPRCVRLDTFGGFENAETVGETRI